MPFFLTYCLLKIVFNFSLARSRARQSITHGGLAGLSLAVNHNLGDY